MFGVKLSMQYYERVHIREKKTKEKESCTRWKWLANATAICDDTLMAAAKLYCLPNWDMNDATIRIIKARIRHDSITHRLSHGCTLYAYTHTTFCSGNGNGNDVGIGIGAACIPMCSTFFSFSDRISAFAKPEQYFLNIWVTEKRILFNENFFLAVLD